MRLPGAPVTNHHDVFLSYSHADLDVATNLRGQLDRCGLTVFRDQERLREGDLWLEALQEAVDACGSFVVLVGRDGVRRWVGAETQVALNRYFGPQDDAERLPIFPILLGETDPAGLPAFLKLFQATAWNGADPLPESLLGQIRDRALVASKATFDGCPFVGLDAFHPDQANLFFGRHKETLDALACFDTRPGSPPVRWLEINGNSGSGKSSLMNAGLLPLADQGWLWPRTGFEHWRRIGPLMPGERPVAMLAEHLARSFGGEMSDVRRLLDGDERALSEWLRGRKPDDRTAFLLAIDQFEELFTFADPDERGRFDQLLARALDDVECPLFVISTVRTDFLDRFDEMLPRLVPLRNRLGKLWTLPLIGENALREIILGPARLAGLDVSEVQETMVLQARDEPGALPLVQNALQWLWERRANGRLSGRLFTEHGGLAGILSEGADALLDGFGKQRAHALELLFRLVIVDPEGRRHTRRRLPLAEAVAAAGGGAQGRALIDRLAGTRARDDRTANRPLRLITVIEGADDLEGRDGWVNLIHETLIRSQGADSAGRPKPFWPTLWRYIEQHKASAAQRERLQFQAHDWGRRQGFGRLFGLAGWWGLLRFRGLAAPGSIETRYLRWSRWVALAQGIVLAVVLAPVIEGLYWATSRGLPLEVMVERWAYHLWRKPPLPDLVEIPAGSLVMEATDGQPAREVTFAQPFRIGSTVVTFDEWDACVADSGCRGLRADDQGWERGSHPVINVSWEDVQAYVAWLSTTTGEACRLPGELEWEYACRAGTQKAYALPPPTGGDDIAGEGLANCWGCGRDWDFWRTTPVASFPANSWGLYDMHGNVWEWVEECRHTGARAGGMGQGEEACLGRVARGGSWNDDVSAARCGASGSFYPDLRDSYIGFRVICSSAVDSR
jgi:formylglycine-generating enzyme required for sulfatase activity